MNKNFDFIDTSPKTNSSNSDKIIFNENEAHNIAWKETDTQYVSNYTDDTSHEIENINIFDETIQLSLKDKKIKFNSGVEMYKVSDCSTTDEIKIIYEINNPTEFRIEAKIYDSLLYNQQNEIIEKSGSSLFCYDYHYPIEPHSKKLLQIDLNSYSLFEFETFEEEPHQYINVENNRFVILKTGLYLI